MNNKKVYENSIVLIGPVGAGKSLLSSKLGEKTGMPVITTDLLRHCPKNLEEIEARKVGLLERINKLENSKSFKSQSGLQAEINSLKNECWVCDRQIEMRTLLPNVPNYKDLGFDSRISNYARELGIVEWHFYQKQFENQLLKSVVSNLKTPAIIDMGGGMAISLDEEYEDIAYDLKTFNPVMFQRYVDMSNIGFNHIKEALAPFKNVVELVLPEEYKESMEKASLDKLNDKFIKSGQYAMLATKHVSVEGLISEVDYNAERANQIVDEISAEVVM